MTRSRLTLLVIVLLVLCLVAVAAACTQQDSPGPESSPTAQAIDAAEATPSLKPTDRSVPPPDVPPTDTPTPAPTIGATHTPETVPIPEAADTPASIPTVQPTDTPETAVPPECMGLDPTNTPDPNRPEGILGKDSQSWNVSSFEEAECITDYPIAIPTNLPDGFVRGENIIVHKTGTSHFEDRWVEHGWGIPGDPPYGFRLEQHSWPFSLGSGVPAMINGIQGETYFRAAIPPDLPPLRVFHWEEGGYWFTISGFLDGPITEEFLLEVAASLELRDAAPATHTPTVSQACSALDPTSTPDPNRPEGIRGMSSEFWNVSSFEEAECITGFVAAIPTNLPDGFIRGKNIIVYKRSTSHFEDRWVEHGWYVPGDPAYGFRLSQHTRKFGLGNGEPAVINGVPGERLLEPGRATDFGPWLTLLWEKDGYWFTIFGVLHGPITEEYLLEVAASLQAPEDGSG